MNDNDDEQDPGRNTLGRTADITQHHPNSLVLQTAARSSACRGIAGVGQMAKTSLSGQILQPGVPVATKSQSSRHTPESAD